MDYPHPYFKLNGDAVDFSDAYDTGIGEWDKVTVAYAYSDFPQGTNEKEALNAILENAQKDGLRYLSDQDARPMGSASAFAHLWDSGSSATQELDRVLGIRKQAISNFSEDNIKQGEPYSVLEDVFVPLYFMHRYQIEAASKVIGGLDYNYRLKGDGQKSVVTVDKVSQENALKTMLKTLEPEVLAIPKEKLELFPPRSIGYPRTRESFKGKTGVAFDPYGAAETAATATLGLLLHHQRANRLVQQKSLNEDQMGFDDMVTTVLDNTIKSKREKGYAGEIQKLVNWQVLQHLMSVASHKESYPQVTETVLFEMMRLKTYLGDGPRATNPTDILLKKEVEKFIGNPKGYEVKLKAPKIPDGSPIGMDCLETNWGNSFE